MNKKNIIIISISVIIVILVSILSYTFAYFAFSANNTNTITGDAATPDIKLEVTKITPTEEYNSLKLVPLLDTAISKAVKGETGQGSCIDSNGNLSCQVYKIKVTNTGTVNLVLRGKIKIEPQNTSSNFSNIKWTRLSNSTTVINVTDKHLGQTESFIDQNITLNKNTSSEYYFALWISETISYPQNSIDSGEFIGTVTFEDDNGLGATAKFNS
jgi:hypothetical protein